jgi:hypothetical protein
METSDSAGKITLGEHLLSSAERLDSELSLMISSVQQRLPVPTDSGMMITSYIDSRCLF